MAIEFNCPYCTATIRVPDPYAGKQGRCPKCDTRLVVPMVARPGSTAPVVSPTEATRLPATEPGPLSVAGSELHSALPTDAFTIKPTSPVLATSRRRRGRRRPSRALVIGVPVIGFLVLLGIIFYSVISGLPDLKGQLPARRLAVSSLPRVTIPWADTGLSDADRSVLKVFLQVTPETLSSQIMTCRLIGADDGIVVQFTAASGNQWIAVDTSADKPLALWLKKERPALSMRRANALSANLVSYCRDKLTQIRGGQIVIDAVLVRDGIGFLANGGPLSSVVEAVAGARLLPCAGEDEKGTLYFCLPKETQTFRILGRTFPDGSKPFTGDYTVVVPGETVTTELPEAAPAGSKLDQSAPATKDTTSEPDASPESAASSTASSDGNMTDKPKSE